MKKYKIFLISILVLTLIIVTGCQSDGADSEVDASDSAENSKEPVMGGILNVATTAETPTLDWGAQGATQTKLIAWHFFEQLVAYDENFEIKPMLVDDYEISEDGKEYSFKLREGVNFHDGTTMDTEDVIASLERWERVSDIGKRTFEEIDEIVKVDEYNFKILLNREYSLLLGNLAELNYGMIVVPAEIAEEAGDNHLNNEQIVGTGPYKFEEWEMGTQLTLSRFEDYTPREEDWGGLTGNKTAYYDEIHFKVVTDPQVRINGLQTGQYDFAQEIPQDLYDSIVQNTAMEPVLFDLGSWYMAMVNHSKPPFDDVRLRQAANHALNKSEIMQAAFGTEDFYTIDGSVFSPLQTSLYTNEGTEMYDSYDPEEAKRLIAESDYDGELIELITTTDYASYPKMAQVAERQLSEVGFNVKIENYEWATLLDNRGDPEAWNLLVVGWPWYYDPVSAAMFRDGERSGWGDLTEIREIQESWITAVDENEKDELLVELNETVLENMIHIKFGNESKLHAISKEISQFEQWDQLRFWNNGFSSEDFID